MGDIPDLIALAKSVAVTAGLEPALVCAVCEKESSWNPWAVRAEPAFDEKYVKPLHWTPTEEWSRSLSWGLLQLMGQSARERGFTGKFLTQLCDPATGLQWGCAHLTFKLKLAGGDVKQGLLYWNGGGDPAYADKVFALMEKYR